MRTARARDGAWRTDGLWAIGLVLATALCIPVSLWSGHVANLFYLAIPGIVVAYLAGRRMASFAIAMWAFALVAAAGLVVAFLVPDVDPLSEWFLMVAFALIVVIIPWWIGRYRLLRAEQRGRERAIVAERARLRERARIAEEMHDNLGHELALIALQGGALELSRGISSEQSRQVAEIRASAVRASERLREIVDVVRDPDGTSSRRPADESIDDLVARAQSSGMPVRLVRAGEPGTPTPIVSLAAHRVIQEALTNAAKYAPGAEVVVTIGNVGHGTDVQVVNGPPTGPGTASAGGGQGILGLQERVRLLGGVLVTEPTPEGGFRVAAQLPHRPDESGSPEPGLGEPLSPASLSSTDGRRLTRRRIRQAARVPLAVIAGVLIILIGAWVVTFAQTNLSPMTYSGLRLGQSYADIADELPTGLDISTPILEEPPKPAGSRCDYFAARTSVLDLSSSMFRLCFVDDILVSKDLLEER